MEQNMHPYRDMMTYVWRPDELNQTEIYKGQHCQATLYSNAMEGRWLVVLSGRLTDAHEWIGMNQEQARTMGARFVHEVDKAFEGIPESWLLRFTFPLSRFVAGPINATRVGTWGFLEGPFGHKIELESWTQLVKLAEYLRRKTEARQQAYQRGIEKEFEYARDPGTMEEILEI